MQQVKQKEKSESRNKTKKITERAASTIMKLITQQIILQHHRHKLYLLWQPKGSAAGTIHGKNDKYFGPASGMNDWLHQFVLCFLYRFLCSLLFWLHIWLSEVHYVQSLFSHLYFSNIFLLAVTRFSSSLTTQVTNTLYAVHTHMHTHKLNGTHSLSFDTNTIHS